VDDRTHAERVPVRRGLVEEGKRRGDITSEARSGDIAWTLLLHAWGEDIARLLGIDHYIAEGASERILERALESYKAPSAKNPATS
jgi:hypothetical protein